MVTNLQTMRAFKIFFVAAVCATVSATKDEVINLRRSVYTVPNEQQLQEPTRRVFVKYRRNRRSAFQAELQQRSSQTRVHYDFKGLDTFVMTLPESEVESLKANPDVVVVRDDVPRYPQYIPESAKRHRLQTDEEVTPYGIDMVQAREVWKLGARGQNVTVCVVDTGVYGTHEDLPRVSGLDSSEMPWDDDGVGHGTHCAGIIAAEEGNGKGVVGVAPDANIFSVKVFTDSGGYAYSSGILAAAQQCVSNGASVISMSLGGPLPNIFEVWGFRQILEEDNVLTVAAAGNAGNGVWSFPASYPSVISVGALDRNKTIAPFSQFNRQVDIAAPGVDILSTFPMKAPCLICDREGYDYGTISGTSMATPHIAGVLALLKSFKPTATPAELVDALMSSAEDLGESGKDNSYGNGLAQAYAAALYMDGGSRPVSYLQPSKSTDCAEDEMMFHLKLLTDDRASETNWELRRITDNGVQLSGAGYADNTAVAFEQCIPRNCYMFTVRDSVGDGLCCSHGDGAFSLMVDGDVIVRNGGEFDWEDTMAFGECTGDNSSESKPIKH